jgi:hypothetical protein
VINFKIESANLTSGLPSKCKKSPTGPTIPTWRVHGATTKRNGPGTKPPLIKSKRKMLIFALVWRLASIRPRVPTTAPASLMPRIGLATNPMIVITA